MVCYIGGHESVVGEIQSKLGIGLGQTTPDGRFTLLPAVGAGIVWGPVAAYFLLSGSTCQRCAGDFCAFEVAKLVALA